MSHWSNWDGQRLWFFFTALLLVVWWQNQIIKSTWHLKDEEKIKKLWRIICMSLWKCHQIEDDIDFTKKLKNSVNNKGWWQKLLILKIDNSKMEIQWTYNGTLNVVRNKIEKSQVQNGYLFHCIYLCIIPLNITNITNNKWKNQL